MGQENSWGQGPLAAPPSFWIQCLQPLEIPNRAWPESQRSMGLGQGRDLLSSHLDGAGTVKEADPNRRWIRNPAGAYGEQWSRQNRNPETQIWKSVWRSSAVKKPYVKVTPISIART